MTVSMKHNWRSATRCKRRRGHEPRAVHVDQIEIVLSSGGTDGADLLLQVEHEASGIERGLVPRVIRSARNLADGHSKRLKLLHQRAAAWKQDMRLPSISLHRFHGIEQSLLRAARFAELIQKQYFHWDVRAASASTKKYTGRIRQ